MTSRDLSLGDSDPSIPGPTEAALPFVEDERGVVDAVFPTRRARTKAEVDLFAVSQPESCDIETADLFERGPSDEHAETYAGWDSRVQALRVSHHDPGEALEVETGWQAIDLERSRQRSQRPVVREGRHRREA